MTKPITGDQVKQFLDTFAETALVWQRSNTTDLPNRINKKIAEEEMSNFFESILNKEQITDAAEYEADDDTLTDLIPTFEQMGIWNEGGQITDDFRSHLKYGKVTTVKADDGNNCGGYKMTVNDIEISLIKTIYSYEGESTYCFGSQYI